MCAKCKLPPAADPSFCSKQTLHHLATRRGLPEILVRFLPRMLNGGSIACVHCASATSDTHCEIFGTEATPFLLCRMFAWTDRATRRRDVSGLCWPDWRRASFTLSRTLILRPQTRFWSLRSRSSGSDLNRQYAVTHSESLPTFYCQCQALRALTLWTAANLQRPSNSASRRWPMRSSAVVRSAARPRLRSAAVPPA